MTRLLLGPFTRPDAARRGEPDPACGRHRRGDRPLRVAAAIAADRTSFSDPRAGSALLIAVVLTNPRRLTRETRISRSAALLLTALVLVTNLVSLGLLIHDLVSKKVHSGGSLLLSALQVWATDVIAFGLVYWALDRGGPVARTQTPRERLPLADFRFSQDENDDNVVEVGGSSIQADWIPTFIDYLYLSTTNSSAFSPTDTMPLTSRAKVLMGIQATAALLRPCWSSPAPFPLCSSRCARLTARRGDESTNPDHHAHVLYQRGL